jgi:hypothetical protein
MRKKTITLLTLGLLLVGALVYGCQLYNEKNEWVPVSLGKYNHNYIKGQPIQDYGVRIEVNGKPQSQLSGYGGGTIPGLSVPRHWKPGIMAVVFWTYGTEPEDAIPHTAEAEIPEYGPEKIGQVHLHFYPGDKVKVVVTHYDLGHPYYPLPKEDWAPWKLKESWTDAVLKKKARGLPQPPRIEREWGRQWGITLDDD